MIELHRLFSRLDAGSDTPSPCASLIQARNDFLNELPRSGAHGEFQAMIHRITELIETKQILIGSHRHGIFDVAGSMLLDVLRIIQGERLPHELTPCPKRNLYKGRERELQNQLRLRHDGEIPIGAVRFLNFESHQIILILADNAISRHLDLRNITFCIVMDNHRIYFFFEP